MRPGSLGGLCRNRTRYRTASLAGAARRFGRSAPPTIAFLGYPNPFRSSYGVLQFSGDGGDWDAGCGSKRGRRLPRGPLHCLSLCTNLVMAYNTSHLQQTLCLWKRQSGREVDAKLLRHIAPMGFEHINFNDVINFPLAHYRTQLFAAQGRARSYRGAGGGQSAPRLGQ